MSGGTQPVPRSKSTTAQYPTKNSGGIKTAMSADIAFCPLVATWDCPLMAIRPPSVVGNRTFASAAYRILSASSSGFERWLGRAWSTAVVCGRNVVVGSGVTSPKN